MDAESQLLAEKDAEVKRLKAQVESVRDELREQWERMQKENLALKDRVAENEENLHKAGVRLGVLSVKLGNKDRLITELCDALESKACFGFEYNDLIQRAREATR